MAKNIETNLTIKAVDKYSGTLKRLAGVTGRFADRVRADMQGLQNLRGPLKLIDDFRRQQDAVRKSGAALEQARSRVRELLAAIKATKHPTAQMRTEFDRARQAAARLEQRHTAQRRALGALRGKLREAGVNTANLAAEQRRLKAATDQATAGFDRQIAKMEHLDRMQRRIAADRERLNRSMTTATGLTAGGFAMVNTGRRIMAGLQAPLQAAISFESAMADVRKVVDFDTPDGFKKLSSGILDLSTRIPMSAEQLAQITASAGQIGLPVDELLQFTEMAAKVGVAFDISADRAGDAMAAIKTAMGLTLDETGAMFDAMNHLSNESAATAPKTMEFMNRAGSFGSTYGFDPTETLAFGAAMIAAGAGADTAATSFRKLGGALTKGQSATDRQLKAFEMLGLSATDVAKAMQNDAVGTSMDVLRRVAELPDHLRASAMSDLFGEEARELNKLVANMQLLPDMLELVADETDYLGSADAEFAERAKTTAANLQRMGNQLMMLGITIGEVVLPPINEFLAMMQPIIKKITAWAKAHPGLTKNLVIGAAAIGALSIAAGGLMMTAGGVVASIAMLRFGLSVLGARGAYAASSLAGLGRAIPNFRPATAAIRGFAGTVATEMAAAEAATAAHTAAMNAMIGKLGRRALFKAVGGLGFLYPYFSYRALTEAPADPDELAEWQIKNGAALEAGLMNLSAGGLIKSGLDWVNSGLGLFGVSPLESDMLDAFLSAGPMGVKPIKEITDGQNWVRQQLGLDPMKTMADLAAERDAAAVALPPEIASAEETVRAAAGKALPSPENLSHLRDRIAEVKAEIEGLNSFTTTYGMELTGAQQVSLDAKVRELAALEAEAAAAEASADDLTAALQVLSETGAAPEINTASIEAALARVQALRAELAGLGSGAASASGSSGASPERKTSGSGRARGGPIRAGLPYLINERTPRSEWIVPSQSGAVMNVGQARQVFAKHLRSAGLAAAVALPAAGAAAGPGEVSVQIGSISVVAPSGVTDPEGLVDEIERRLGQRITDTMRASFTR